MVRVKNLLRLFRLAGLVWVFFRITLRWYFEVVRHGHQHLLSRRAEWMRNSAKSLADHMRLEIRLQGVPPENGVLISNHLGYLDILVLGSVRPTIFVSKAEVRSWPWVGWLTECAGTLFIDRESRKDVARLREGIEARLSQGVPIAFFPEGTSTGGGEFLPFRPSLLEPACSSGCMVTPAFIAYDLPEGGDVSEEVCYWKDMTFGPHIWNLLDKPRIVASVIYGKARDPGSDRKVLAKTLQEEVQELRRIYSSGSMTARQV